MRRALAPLALLVSTGVAAAAPQSAVCLKRSAFAGLVTSRTDALLVDEGRYVSFAAETPAVVEKPSTIAPEGRVPDAIVHRVRGYRHATGAPAGRWGRTWPRCSPTLLTRMREWRAA